MSEYSSSSGVALENEGVEVSEYSSSIAIAREAPKDEEIALS